VELTAPSALNAGRGQLPGALNLRSETRFILLPMRLAVPNLSVWRSSQVKTKNNTIP